MMMSGSLLPVAVAILLVGIVPFTAQGWNIHYYDFVLREKNFTRLCVSRPIMTVNDSLPGPVIRARRGDKVFVNVHNQGDYGLTIHWHGVKQPRNPWSDGPVYITQCPILPLTNFTYEIDLTEEEGTLWWHAHSDWTRETVHGAIVVLPSEGSTYPFPEPDGEQVIVIGTWYEGILNEVIKAELEDGGTIPQSISYLINGEPGDFAMCSTDTTHRWQVEYGKTYLIRLVTAVLDAAVFFAIAGHNLTVVGVDGAYIKPIVTSYVVASPGRTMDILLTTNQTKGLYYMAAREYESEDLVVTLFDHSNATAILQYDGNYSSSSIPVFPSNLPSYRDFWDAVNFTGRFRSLGSDEHPIDVPQDITTRMFIVASMNSIDCTEQCVFENKTVSSVNNVSWLDPPVDVLQAYYRNMSGIYETDFPDFPPTMYNFTGDYFTADITLTYKGTRVKVLNYNESVEVVFQGTNILHGSMDHPMHLHGYSFYVVGSGNANFDNVTGPLSYNLVDPPKVNTFSIPKKGWLAIRFRANNPGVWFWHCHLEHHQSWGMNGVFIVKDGDTEETSMRPPPLQMPSCPSWSITALDESNGEVGPSSDNPMNTLKTLPTFATLMSYESIPSFPLICSASSG